MNELELKQLWQAANDKLEESVALHHKNQTDIASIKVHGLLASIKPAKIFLLLAGLLWVGIGGSALGSIYRNAFAGANKFFLFSATTQVALTAVALVIYLYQIITIYQVDITDPILKTQARLANLKISTLWVARILFLQLPVWTTFWWNETMLTDWNMLQWAVALLLTGAFTALSLWLFFHIRYENRHQKWFQFIFNGKEWLPLMKAMQLLEQVEEYKGEHR